ncbi:MAG: helix-turn-helix transcriptional regulator [Deltaproteobacteria bacterium]|nr:helix-turn-helix transcriptional regulator [Deltaproteobacteria bacterium]
MLARTEKHHTDEKEFVTFIIPRGQTEEVINKMKALGFEFVPESKPWRECFPEIKDEDLPAISLRGARGKEELTQKQLADRTGIPQRHISEMEHGKRPIGKERAKVLGKALNIDYRVFL